MLTLNYTFDKICHNSETLFKLYWPRKAVLHTLSSHMSVTNSNGEIIMQQLDLVSMIPFTKTIHYQDSLK